jgi:hypothetical protein
VEPKLRSLEQVKGLLDLGSENGSSRFAVISEQGSGIEEKLFRLVVESGWVMTELRPETLSLEQVFQQLTRGEAV